MHEFIDRYGRRIEIEVFDNAEAYYEKRKIGEVQTTGPREISVYTADLPPKITGWSVERSFQQSGIATEMVRLLFEEMGQMEPPDKNIGIGGQNTLTDDGLKLTESCQAKGYLLPFDER